MNEFENGFHNENLENNRINNLVECPVLLYNKLENYPSKRYITPFFPYIYPFWVMEVHFYD